MNSLPARLKERKLVQWAAGYLAGAWLVLQVGGELRDTFGWPPVVVQVLTVLLGVGFFAALVLAWYHGEQGAQRVSGIELLMLSAILVAAGAAVAWVGGDEAEVSRPALALPDTETPRTARSSLAVLPFANMSADPENEYFSDGITEEILTTLANVGDLRVISRTSVMRYKNTEKALREIAAELGVAHVLEGSVQKAGERVRITAQLIDARTDAHLWAERYDRPLQDIFAVQSEIAQQIAAALQAELSPVEQKRLGRQPTTNLAAYDHLLRGQELVRTPNPRSTEMALSHFRRARELDPTYPEVHAGLASAFFWQFWWGGDRRWLDSAVAAGRRAVELDPTFAEGHAELGYALNLRGDLHAALEPLRRAVQLNPNFSRGLADVYHYGFGRLDEAARWWRPALERDPSNAFLFKMAGRTYFHLGMPAQARLLLEKAIRMAPQLHWAYELSSQTYLMEGRPAEAREMIQRMLAVSDSASDALVAAGITTAAMGDLSTARRYLERGLPGASDWERNRGASILVWILQRDGEGERARALLQDAALRLRRRHGGEPKRPEDFIDLVRVAILQGDREEALRLMEEGVRRGWRFYNEPFGDPILSSLRGDVQFDRIMAEVSADVSRQRSRVLREGW